MEQSSSPPVPQPLLRRHFGFPSDDGAPPASKGSRKCLPPAALRGLCSRTPAGIATRRWAQRRQRLKLLPLPPLPPAACKAWAAPSVCPPLQGAGGGSLSGGVNGNPIIPACAMWMREAEDLTGRGWGEKRHSAMGASDEPKASQGQAPRGVCRVLCLFSTPKWSASKTSCLVLGLPLGVQGWESFQD